MRKLRLQGGKGSGLLGSKLKAAFQSALKRRRSSVVVIAS
jgi:hypothetical protein